MGQIVDSKMIDRTSNHFLRLNRICIKSNLKGCLEKVSINSV